MGSHPPQVLPAKIPRSGDTAAPAFSVPYSYRSIQQRRGYREWSRMTYVVKTVRLTEEETDFLEWQQSKLGLRTFSETFRYLLRRYQEEGLTPQEDKARRIFLREQRKAEREALPPAPVDPTHCGGCGKGDPWFTWYPSYEGSDEVGRCQGCSILTYRDAVA